MTKIQSVENHHNKIISCDHARLSRASIPIRQHFKVLKYEIFKYKVSQTQHLLAFSRYGDN